MRTYTEMDFHRIAALFPLIEGDDLEEMADDIAAHGLHHAITLYEGQILDGRNRYRACLLRGVEPRYQQFDPAWGSPTAWVISENALRRHLTSSQLSAIGHESKRFFDSEMRERQRDGQERGRAARYGAELVPVQKDINQGTKQTARQLAARAVGVAETGQHKIGFARQVSSRVCRLGTQTPYRLALVHSFYSEDARATEKELHDRFKSKRVRGEWFALTAEDVAWFKSLNRGAPRRTDSP